MNEFEQKQINIICQHKFQTPCSKQAPRYECITENYFLISQPKHMFKLMDKKRITTLR